MAIGLAALQTVLEEGNKDDWFASPFIFRLAIVAAVFLTRLHRDRAHGAKAARQPAASSSAAISASASSSSSCIGFALFGTIYILPQYLGQAQGYNAEQIGEVLAWTGLPQLVVIPFVPMLMKRFDVRAIAFVGVGVFAASCFMNVMLSGDSAGDQFFVPNIVRAHRPGPGADADQRHHDRRHRAERSGRRLGPLQHAAQPRRRGRHGDARDHHHQARAVSLERHRPVDHARQRGGPPAHRSR